MPPEDTNRYLKRESITQLTKDIDLALKDHDIDEPL